MNDPIEPPTCPVCEGALLGQRHAWLLACQECDCLASTLEVRVNADDVPLDEITRVKALRSLRQGAFEKVLDRMAAAGLPAGSCILDVGCAHGWFLEQANARGYRSIGIEPDRAIATTAIAKGVDVMVGMFPDALSAGETYDAVVFNDVFEHLPDVVKATTAARSHLRQDGLLVINIPLTTGFFYRLSDFLDRIGYHGPFERMWQKGFASPHRFYFRKSHLVRLAEQHGFAFVSGTSVLSLKVSGLWQRLRYDKSRPLILSLLMWPAIVLIAPIVRLLPQDIGLLIFRTAGREL